MSIHIIPARDSEGKRRFEPEDTFTEPAKKTNVDEETRRFKNVSVSFGSCTPLATSETHKITVDFLRNIKLLSSSASALVYTGNAGAGRNQTITYSKIGEIARGAFGVVYRYQMDPDAIIDNTPLPRPLPFYMNIWNTLFSSGKKTVPQPAIQFYAPKFLALKKFLEDDKKYAQNIKMKLRKQFDKIEMLEIEKEKKVLEILENKNDACAQLRVAAAVLDGPNQTPKYVVMENMDGSLRDFINVCDATKTIQILNGVCHMLDCFRQSGFLYADLKPDNIMYRCENGAYHTYLGDFGSVYVDPKDAFSVYTYIPPLSWPSGWYNGFPSNFRWGFMPAQEWHLIYLTGFLAFFLWKTKLFNLSSDFIMTPNRYNFDPDVYAEWSSVSELCAIFQSTFVGFVQWEECTEFVWVESAPDEPLERAFYFLSKDKARNKISVKELMMDTGKGLLNETFDPEKCFKIDVFTEVMLMKMINRALHKPHITREEKILLQAIDFCFEARTNNATINDLEKLLSIS